MAVILKAEHISKQYRLGLVGTGTLGDDLKRFWHKIQGKEDPFLKVGAVNDRSTKADGDYVWALQDINFEVQQGEVLGIIGKNGAGKSTLLKILSRVTAPTTGEIKTKGRIASLLEVGTGFHPELTGRENIYLNGAILGMTKSEIRNKESEIIDFSGCARYIDTPVKRYSSGMRVRLAFAVAAFLEPDILVIDEVLAVGDAEFQKKAIGKMQDISKGEGRTVLFVSHNMESIQKLCNRCIFMDNGFISYDGSVDKAITEYLSVNDDSIIERWPIKLKDLTINNFCLKNKGNDQVESFVLGEKCQFSLSLEVHNKINLDLNIRIQIFDEYENLMTTLNTYHTNDIVKLNSFTGSINATCDIEKWPLTSNNYILGIEIMNLKSKEKIYTNRNFYTFSSINGDFFGSGKLPLSINSGKTMIQHQWSVNELKL